MIQSPRELAEKRVELAAEYARDSERLGILRAGKAIKWLLARKNAKTDKEATMILEASQEGQEEIKLLFKTKGLEKEISSISALLRVLDGEARGQF